MLNGRAVDCPWTWSLNDALPGVFTRCEGITDTKPVSDAGRVISTVGRSAAGALVAIVEIGVGTVVSPLSTSATPTSYVVASSAGTHIPVVQQGVLATSCHVPPTVRR